MTKAKEASEDLKKEAVRILGLAGMAHVNAARVVDCIVMAAMLEIADVQAAALRKEQGDGMIQQTCYDKNMGEQFTCQEVARECLKIVDSYIGTDDISRKIVNKFKLEG